MPHPGLGLFGALGRQAGFSQGLTVAPHRLPDLVQAAIVQRRDLQHRHLPGVVQRPQHSQRGLIFGRGPARRPRHIAIGLVDHHQIGQLDNTLLDALQFIAATGQQQKGEEIDHISHRRFRLADPHRFNHHHVEAGGLAQQHHFPGAPRHAAKRPRRGRRTNEGRVIARQLLHPGFVAEDRAPGPPRRRIDGQHRHLVALADGGKAESLDEGGLAHPGHAGNAQANRAPGFRQQPRQQRLGLFPVVAPG